MHACVAAMVELEQGAGERARTHTMWQELIRLKLQGCMLVARDSGGENVCYGLDRLHIAEPGAPGPPA